MANNITGTVWKIDTAGVITTAHIRLSHIRWVSKTASAGDGCIITDAAGRVLFEDYASGANYVSADRPEVSVPGGIIVTLLDSGTIYLAV